MRIYVFSFLQLESNCAKTYLSRYGITRSQIPSEIRADDYRFFEVDDLTEAGWPVRPTVIGSYRENGYGEEEGKYSQ
jgi:hypothetical protein